MREIIDIFSGNAFSAVTLTAQVNNVPFTPNFLGSLGLYAYDGVRTVDIAVGEKNGQLTIIKSSPRGAPPEQQPKPKGTVRKATAVRLAREAEVAADEVQGVLSNSDPALAELQTPAALIQERLEGPFGLRAAMELTHEYHRLGGIKGVVLDADGSVLWDWYSFFGIAALDDHNTNFGALTVDGGAFELECAALKRAMVKELNGLPLAQMRPVALCGDSYYDQVYSNKEVKAARKNGDAGRGRDGDVFSQNKAYSSFEYGGITWLNYRGTDDGAVSVATGEARLFPMGVPGLFQMLFCPPDILGLTNTKGLPLYAFMPPERQTSRMAVVEAQSNCLTLNLRPRSLRRLTKA